MIYILCFERPFKHARHYVGFTKRNDVAERVEQHLKGQGSPLLRAVVAAGIPVVLATSFEGTRDDERTLKNCKNAAFFCPRCRKAYLQKKAGQKREQRRAKIAS